MIAKVARQVRDGAPVLVRTVGRRAVKRAASPLLAVARASGLFGLASGFVSAHEARDSLERAGVKALAIDLSGPPRTLRPLGQGDAPPALKPTTTVATLFDGGVESLSFRDNLVIDPWGRVVFPRATDEDGRQFTLRDLRPWRVPLERPRRVRGSIAYLSDTSVQNFGHWMLYVFPLVGLYREYLGDDPDFFYLGKRTQAWHYDSLAELGISRERILTDAVSGDRMLAAIADSTFPTPTRFLDFTTSALRLPPDPSEPSRRIYISRRLRPTRPLANEEACLAVLERHGFRSYCTEMLTLREERELFANAEAVVAVHGAGVANLLLCPEGCVVVELFAHCFTSTWFAEACAARGQVYASLHGEPMTARGLPGKHQPVFIDTAKLDEVLAAATESVAASRDRDLLTT